MSDKRIQTVVSEDVNDRLAQLALLNHRSKSAEIAVAIERHLEWPYVPQGHR